MIQQVEVDEEGGGASIIVTERTSNKNDRIHLKVKQAPKDASQKIIGIITNIEINIIYQYQF